MLNLGEIGIWFIKLYSLLLVQFLNQIPISQFYFTQIQHATSLLPILIHVKVQVYYYVKNCMLQLVCLEDTSAKYHHIIVMLNLLDPPRPPYTQTMLHVGNSKCSTKFVWGILVQSYFSACNMPTDSMNYTIRVHACRLQLAYKLRDGSMFIIKI